MCYGAGFFFLVWASRVPLFCGYFAAALKISPQQQLICSLERKLPAKSQLCGSLIDVSKKDKHLVTPEFLLIKENERELCEYPDTFSVHLQKC